MRMRGVGATLLAALALFLLAGVLRAETSYPAFDAPVVDAAHVLADADRVRLTGDLLALQRKTGIQFAVATIPSLEGGDIETYANGLFRAWKLGQKDVNNGLLLILAPNERKLRFEVGYGLEGTFTDAQSKLILHNTMVPKLKAGDPAGALIAGVADAIRVLTGEAPRASERPAPPASAPAKSNDPPLFVIVIFFAIILFIVISGWRARRRGGIGWIPVGGGSDWSSDSSSSSSSSDSFSGGGGGDSGGGGASDSY